MTFHRIAQDKVKILLTDEDLSELSIYYEELDCENENTRDIILELLDLAYRETGFYPGEGHLFVEAYPAEQGCILYFTSLCEAQEEQSVCTPVIFAFESSETLIAGARTLFQTYGHRIFKSELYFDGNTYQLAVYPLDQSNLQSVMLLSEFASPSKKGELSVRLLKEHSRVLLPERAIEQLTCYFGK